MQEYTSHPDLIQVAQLVVAIIAFLVGLVIDIFSRKPPRHPPPSPETDKKSEAEEENVNELIISHITRTCVEESFVPDPSAYYDLAESHIAPQRSKVSYRKIGSGINIVRTRVITKETIDRLTRKSTNKKR